jgi:hypothetical protein
MIFEIFPEAEIRLYQFYGARLIRAAEARTVQEFLGPDESLASTDGQVRL